MLYASSTPERHPFFTNADHHATCEVKTPEGWQRASLSEARSYYGMAPKRCPACHGTVQMNGIHSAVSRRQFVHRRKHDGCPLSPDTFSGTASPHPQALS